MHCGTDQLKYDCAEYQLPKLPTVQTKLLLKSKHYIYVFTNANECPHFRRALNSWKSVIVAYLIG